MKSLFYTGQGKQRKEGASNLPASRRSALIDPDKYLPDPGLVDAANVALMLGQPLLLTGEAGTGKTQFAYSFAWELGLDAPFMFETKSTSVARDLFYVYDALRRFQDFQASGKPTGIFPYLTYQALGIAILRTRARKDVKDFLNKDFPDGEKVRSVVLIDEIDKAPRDFPNDILNEIERMYFRIPEEGNIKFESDPALPPIVVITSNSEKDLPDAFLRRCIYYDIPFPDADRLRQIVSNRLGRYVKSESQFLTEALDLFLTIRLPKNGLRKNPATAELLGWIIALKEMAPRKDNPLDDAELVTRTVSNLVKTKDDQKKVHSIVKEWFNKRQKPA